MDKKPSRSTILGIDPSLRGTGYAILQKGGGGDIRALAWGVVSNHPKLSIGGCLLAIHDALDETIKKYNPDCAAIETTIYVQSRQVAITLGCARGAAILAVARHGLPLHEYAPRKVKSASTGFGGARKDQVSFMMRAILGLTETPPSDAADAMAIALAHAQSFVAEK